MRWPGERADGVVDGAHRAHYGPGASFLQGVPRRGYTAPIGLVGTSARPPGRHRALLVSVHPLAWAGAWYAALSLVLWWHVWAHPATVTTCACGDGALTLWVLAWPAHALAHGENPFFSSMLFHPHGIDMAPNSLGLGVLFAPVTWLAGPVATMNVIDALGPPLSALAMAWLLRRWVRPVPAALGGLLYGFSPFVLTELALAHPNFGFAVVPPLVVGVLDDLVTGRGRASWRGVLLGLLVVAEFFVSVEVLALVALLAVPVLVVVVVAGRAEGGWPAVADRAVRVSRGLLAAALVAGALLAYPLWAFFAGPAHLVGRAWPDSPAGTVGATVSSFVSGRLAPPLVAVMHVFGGYQGPALPDPTFVGAGVVAIVVVGLVMWRRSGLLWLFAAVGVVAAALSLGVGSDGWYPWRLFVHLPVLVNVVPVNLASVTDLCAAACVALVVDRVLGRPARSYLPAAAVAVVALVPLLVNLWPNLPVTVRPTTPPRWFTTGAVHLPPGQVVLPYPASFGGIQSSMAWLAVGGMHFSMPGGGGPGVVPSRAGAERPGYELLARASDPLDAPPPITSATLAAMRRALAGWGVGTVVVPSQADLPSYDRGRPVPYAVGLFTALTGRLPVEQDSAWVWRGHPTVAAATGRVDPARVIRCLDDQAALPLAVARCVLETG